MRTEVTLPRRWWIVPLALFALAALVGVTGSNRQVFLAINGLAPLLPEAFWETLTLPGNALVALVLLAAWLRHRPQWVWAALIAAVPATVVIRTLKPLVGWPRPPAVIPADQIHVIGPHYMHTSFPSGDALTIFVLATVACFAFKRTWTRIAVILAGALVAMSRIIIGVHWPIDVLVGAGLGACCAAVGTVLAQRYPWGGLARGRRYVSFFLAACAVALFFHGAGLEGATVVRWIVASVALVLVYQSLRMQGEAPSAGSNSPISS
jgi:membrane-associated phospholipid phosphatase